MGGDNNFIKRINKNVLFCIFVLTCLFVCPIIVFKPIFADYEFI